MIPYLLANWKQLAGVAAAFGVVGYALHRCPEAMHLAEAESAKVDAKATTDTAAREGPKHRAGINFDPAPGAPASVVIVPGIGPIAVPAGERIEAVDVEEDAGSETETHAVAETQAISERKLDLTVTPAPRPGWAVQVGTEDLLSLNSVKMAEELRLAGRRRLFGPNWGEVSTKPLHRCDDGRWCPTVGAALSFEF